MTIETFLAFSCTHCPLQDENAISWLLDQIAFRRPDYIIHLGDGHEADAASRFVSEYDWDLRDEFNEHNSVLRDIRLAYSPAKRVFLPGNHDANILEWNRINKKLRGLCNFMEYEPELRNYWSVPSLYEYSTRGVFRLGQVTFGHGYSSAANADEIMAIEFCVPFGLWVGGHTHKPVDVTRARKNARVSLPFWYSNAGCMRTLKPHYARRIRTFGWGQAVVVGEFLRDFRYNQLRPQWSAETVIYRTGEFTNEEDTRDGFQNRNSSRT